MNYTEAKEESERLTRMIKREIEPRQVQCKCGGDWQFCPNCTDGLFYDLYFTFCDHVVSDGPDTYCEDQECAERERAAEIAREEMPFRDPFVSAPLRSLSEVNSSREEEMEYTR